MGNRPGREHEAGQWTGRSTVTRVAVVTFVVIFVAEFLIMELLGFDLDHPINHSLLDAGLLVAILVPILYFLVFRPLSKSREVAQASQERLRGILDNIPGVVYMKDLQGRYVFANRRLNELAGRDLQGIQGHTDYHIFPPEFADAFRENDRKVLATQASLTFEEMAPHPDGPHTYLSVKFPCHNGASAPLGVCGISIDITERKEIERQLLRFKTILDATPDFVGIADRDGRTRYVNRAIRNLRSLPPDTDISQYVIEDFHSPASYELLTKEAIPTAIREGSWHGETEFRAADGRLVPTSQIVLAHGSDGEVEYLSTIARDITELKRAGQALRRSEAKYRALFEAAYDGILLCTCNPDDLQHRFVDCNPRMLTMLSARPEDVIGKTPVDISPPQQPDGQPSGEKARHMLSAALAGVPQTFEWTYKRTDGSLFEAEVTLSPIELDDERFVQGIVRDISDRKRAEERIRRMAHYDQLTGLANRALFYDRLNHALAQAKRNLHPFAVLFLDLDGFKAVNDSLGHEAGDELLREVAQRLQTCVRGSDTVARIGGDEFTFIVAEPHHPDDIAKIADKILGILTTPFELRGERFIIGASIGIALYPADGRELNVLLRHADMAMFRAKNSGKNRYSFYHSAA